MNNIVVISKKNNDQPQMRTITLKTMLTKNQRVKIRMNEINLQLIYIYIHIYIYIYNGYNKIVQYCYDSNNDKNKLQQNIKIQV